MNYGLIGEKLPHSFSALIHRQLFDYEYELKELRPDELELFMRARDFQAINVTIPYKEAVIPYLDDMDDVAASIGAVNTIVHRNGKLYGYNTDFLGLCALIERSGISLTDKKVLILGSGGTSKTAMAVARRLGCAVAWRVSRTAREGCLTYEQAKVHHWDAQVIINTTPCGMYPNSGESPVDLSDYPHLEGVVDVIYNPLRTRLVCDALRRGVPAVGGLYMLVAQAAFAAERFVGSSVLPERIDEIYRCLLAEKENIVLVGMPACGKSTVGKRLAEMLDRPFVDTDALIVDKTGCAIPALFERVGESGFRDYEAQVVAEVSVRQGAIIATGGGAVLRPENVERLKENGRLYFLDRSVGLLTATADRPLSATPAELQRRYAERYPIYSAVCDAKIVADGSSEEVANLIREGFLYEHFGNQRP